MRKRGYSRVEDSTFELNLAPMLDIIVAVVPMLLISVVFVRVMMIETPIPQVVEKAIAAANEQMKDQVSLTLSFTHADGFRFSILEGQNKKEKLVALKGGQLDFDGLHQEALQLKRSYPQVFRIEVSPSSEIPLAELVKTLDSIRTVSKDEKKVMFLDVNSGKQIETDLMFPDIVFGNVTGG